MSVTVGLGVMLGGEVVTLWLEFVIISNFCIMYMYINSEDNIF